MSEQGESRRERNKEPAALVIEPADILNLVDFLSTVFLDNFNAIIYNPFQGFSKV